MNEHRNSGNVNAAIAQTHFRWFDELCQEFISRVHRLASEDHPSALVDMVFNEDNALIFLDSFMQQVIYNQHTDASPADFEDVFKTLLGQLDMRPRFPGSLSPSPSAATPRPEPTLEEFDEEVRALGDFDDDDDEDPQLGYEYAQEGDIDDEDVEYPDE